MNFLSVTTKTWALAGICVLVVFAILVVLVFILGIFTMVASKTASKARSVKATYETIKQTKTFEHASDEDKAAVAMAIYLYEQEQKNQESRVLTITHHSSAWSAQLNPRL